MHRKHTTAEDGMQNARSVSHSGKTLRWYLSFRPVAVLAAAFAALLTTGLFAGSFGVAASAATPHALATSGLGYTALASPVRIADTRAGATDPATYAGKTLAEGTGLTVDIPASLNIPATASAVVVNITAINPTGAGFLTVYPGGGTLPTAANVTFTTGQTVGNNVTVGLGPDGTTSTQSFTVYNGPATGGGSVDFTADVAGYYNAGTGSSYVPIAPTRVYDSRTASGLPGAGTTLTAGGTDNVTVAGGTTGIPATATAVSLNVAITNPTASSFIDAYPAGATAPGTASQNFLAGETLSSQVVAGVGTNGQVTIGNHAGTVDIVVDVNGYYTNDGTGGLLTVLASPVRLLDTRTATPPGVAGGASGAAVLQGSGATAGVLSIADLPTSGNFLTAYATGTTAPLAANVNYVPGNTYNVVENAAYSIASASGSVSILNGPSNAGTANIVVDEDGYFTAPPQSFTVVATPASIQANGTATSTIVLTVTNNGAVVSGDPLIYTSPPVSNPAGVCTAANFSNALAPGDTTGMVTYTASHIVGTCTLTVTETQFGLTRSVTITQNDNNSLALLPAGTVLAPHAAPASTGTPSQVPVTATVTAATTGNPVVGDTINFTATPITPGACGPTTSGSAATNGAGVASFTYTAPVGASGFCTITATEASVQTGETAAQTGSTVINSQSGTAPTTVGVNSASVQLGAQTAVTVTTTAAIVGDPINLVAVPSVAGACGTLSPTTGTTVAGGTAAFNYTASSTVGTCTITAIEANGAVKSTTGGVITQTANNNVVVAAPGTVVVSGTAPITATVTTSGGAPVANDDIAFTVTGTGCGTVAPGGAFTNASGVATTTYTASATAGSLCKVVGTEQATPPGTASVGTSGNIDQIS
jgi:hypothetical protein